MTERTRSFLALYSEFRLENQLGWYERRSREFRRKSGRLLNASAVVLAGTSAAGALLGADIEPHALWSILAAILPATATALAATSRLYAFDRQAKLYDDAARSLRRLARQADDLDSAPGAAAEVVAAHAIAVEDVLRREQGQWGQLASEIDLVRPPRAE